MKYSARNKQQGVALVISLIILVSLTMLGLTSIQRTTTDLAMAGNQREIGLMFQAAEAGLSAAHGFIENSDSNNDFSDPNAGLTTVVANNAAYVPINYFAATTWGANSTTANTIMTASFGLADQPRYMIEYLGDQAQNALAMINIGGYGTGQTGLIHSIYRSTARGVGVTGNSFRFVQSYYGKEKP